MFDTIYLYEKLSTLQEEEVRSRVEGRYNKGSFRSWRPRGRRVPFSRVRELLSLLFKGR